MAKQYESGHPEILESRTKFVAFNANGATNPKYETVNRIRFDKPKL